MTMSTVSIIIPTYNRSNLLKECVESLLAQTYHDIEIIVVDDGSTDDTKETLDSITDKQNRIRYYSRPHSGVCAARNFGLEQASGEYIGFFDHDDLWPTDYIETMVKSLKARPDFGVAYSNSTMFGERCGQYRASSRRVSGFITADLFTGKLFFLPSAVIFRKNVWNVIRWDEMLKLGEDFDVFLRISTHTKFIYVPDAYAMHRESDDTAGAMAGKDLVVNAPRVMERFYFQLGGDSFVPRKVAFRKISHRYRSAGLKHYKARNRTASIILLKRALSYDPLDLRLYLNLFKAFLFNPKNDKMPDWRIPEPLTIKFDSPKRHSTKEKKSEAT